MLRRRPAGPDWLRRIAVALSTGASADLDGAGPVLDAIADLPLREAQAYLRGIAASYEARAARVQAELV